MKVCISHMTAFKWYLRNPAIGQHAPRFTKANSTALSVLRMANAGRPDLAGRRSRRAAKASITTQDFDFVIPQSTDLISLCKLLFQNLPPDNAPVDFLVTNPAKRCMRAGITVHITLSTLPGDSFVFIGSFGSLELYIVRPELLFVQLCSQLHADEAIYCGMALCSNYQLCPDADEGIRLRNTTGGALTSSSQLATSLDQYTGINGIKAARKMLPYVLDNSFSPMESGIAMMYRLPANMGGFGYKEVALNKELKFRVSSSNSSRGETVVRRPDVLVCAKGRDQKLRMVGIDYESALVHTRAQNLQRDSARRNEIAMYQDLIYFTLTKEQALEFGAFCDLAEKVRLSLKVRQTPKLRMSHASPEGRQICDEVRHARFKLWAKVVCPSNFRKIG